LGRHLHLHRADPAPPDDARAGAGDRRRRREQARAGSRHSFDGIADAAELISFEGLPADVVVDRDAGTVSLGGGVRYGELVGVLREHGVALHNLASLPHISVAGAAATATHGSGVGNGNLATSVRALELPTSDGEVRTVCRGDADFDGVVVGLGTLGAVTRLTLDVQLAFEVRQRVFEGLGFTPSSGAEIQSEYLVVRRDAPPPSRCCGRSPTACDRCCRCARSGRWPRTSSG
jgi:FAD/FMN-containing dehydrogenase